MSQAAKAEAFAAMHVKGAPVVLYNVWDAGGAKALAEAGAPAIATGSWSMAEAHGYPDGERIPFDLVVRVVDRIAATVDLPVTVDAEGGYAEAPEAVAANIRRLIDAGAIGVNIEDQVVGSDRLHATDIQARRLAAIRETAREAGVPLVINARTDLFLKAAREDHAGLIAEARDRCAAYADAGADCFFVPGLVAADLIGGLCESAALPINVMMTEGVPSRPALAGLGVARLSFGPAPFVTACRDLADRFRQAAA